MSDDDRWRRVERVLDTVLAHESDAWPAALDEACSGDPALRAEVEAYLRRLDDARDFLATPPAAVAAALVAEAGTLGGAHEGRRVGAYRIVREIGRGGMSRVFLAERDDGAFTQTVAVKLLRTGFDDDADQRRFRGERQILASLSHPHITRLFDGGVTEDGVPYLVLEYVDGEPIDRYCERHALTVRERLQLFLDVAEATQYAHRSLVVHRDLKPSNILVTADGDVKLLDFGLAKLLQADVSGATTPQTRVGHRLMTPEYAAPEQLRGEPITTLTDVYQLGAVLYELLTGRRPFAVRAGTLRELEHAVTTTDPPPPSAATAGVLAEQAGGPARTVETAAATRRALRGDLDAIVLQALRKEPDQRYASAQALADDVRRHLAGRPVLARGRAHGYRARRFVRRHRFSLAMAVVIAGLVGAWVGTVIGSRARVQSALDEAVIGARKSEQVTDFMLGLFEADPTGAVLSDTVTARALLNRGLARACATSGWAEL
jgi:eukaryotic-like serine/threonine-protein kinase